MESLNASANFHQKLDCILDSTVDYKDNEDHEVNFWADEEQRQQENRTVLNEANANTTDGTVSPIASTLSSSCQNVSSSQKAYYLRKVRQVFSAVLSTFAPDQEDQVFDALKSSSVSIMNKKSTGVKEEVATNALAILIEVYNQCESRQTRIQILSMFAKHFSKKELREIIPRLSIWQIDQARRHASKEGPGQPVVSPPIKRSLIHSR